jgi:hypothetical protein
VCNIMIFIHMMLLFVPCVCKMGIFITMCACTKEKGSNIDTLKIRFHYKLSSQNHCEPKFLIQTFFNELLWSISLNYHQYYLT